MHIDILGKRWRLRFVNHMSNRGDVDHPSRKGKEIRILNTLDSEERLEVVLHEMLHAADWHLSEEFVDQFAKDAARTLARLGYQRKPPDP